MLKQRGSCRLSACSRLSTTALFGLLVYWGVIEQEISRCNQRFEKRIQMVQSSVGHRKAHVLSFDPNQVILDMLDRNFVNDHLENAWRIALIFVSRFGSSRDTDGIPEIVEQLIDATI